jgi:hypothetical protein
MTAISLQHDALYECRLFPLSSGRGRGGGQVEAWSALADPILPDADANTAIRDRGGHRLQVYPSAVVPCC